MNVTESYIFVILRMGINSTEYGKIYKNSRDPLEARNLVKESGENSKLDFIESLYEQYRISKHYSSS